MKQQINKQILANSPLNVEVSWFNMLRENIPAKTINLFQFLTTPLSANAIEIIDQIRNANEKTVKARLKGKLPAITPCGTFSIRHIDKLISHSNLIPFDIDEAENPDIDMEDLKQQLIKLPQVAYVAFSVGGKGLWGLIPIAYPEKHGGHFDYLCDTFEKLGVFIDRSGRDVTRMRILSKDLAPLFNHDAVPLTEFIEKRVSEFKMKNRQLPIASDDTTPPYLKDYSDLRLIDALSYIASKHRIDITKTRAKWFTVGCVLANTLGEKGREFYHLFSKHHPSYSKAETNCMYNECLRKKYSYSLGTLIFLCKEVGIKRDTILVTLNDTEDYVLL